MPRSPERKEREKERKKERKKNEWPERRRNTNNESVSTTYLDVASVAEG